MPCKCDLALTVQEGAWPRAAINTVYAPGGRCKAARRSVGGYARPWWGGLGLQVIMVGKGYGHKFVYRCCLVVPVG